MPRKKRKKPVDLKFAFKHLKPAAAMKYFRSKGHTLSWDWRDTLGEAHARAFTVAHVARMDILRDIRGAVDEAITEGKTFREFQKSLEPTLRKKGWWGKNKRFNPETGEEESVLEGSPQRLRTIYNTNMKSAYSAGREEFFQRNKDARPYGQFVAIIDPKTRDSHGKLHGKVFRLDDPFWDRFTPPLDFNCRCRKRALSERALKRKGLKALKSEGRMKPEDRVINKKTGETRKVWGYRLPGGGKVFPRVGFDNNPWKAAFQPDLEKYDYDIAKKYIEGAVTGPAFRRFFEGKDKGAFSVGVMNAETLALMPKAARGKQAVTVKYGKPGRRGTIAHVRQHKDISPRDMLRIQEAVDDGMIIAPAKNATHREFLLERDGFLWIYPAEAAAGAMKTITFWKIELGTKNHEGFLKAKLGGGKVLRKQKKR